MAKNKKAELINLLPERGFESTTTGRVLGWLLSTFRIIVIFTEIVVMAAFISRFWLDAQNSQLNEEIQQKQAIIAASAKTENEFKSVQKKLEIYSKLSSTSENNSKALEELSTIIPQDIILDSLSLSPSEIAITGTSPNERSIQQFIVNLNAGQSFDKVILRSLGTDLSNTSILTFSLIMGFEPTKQSN